MTDKVHPSAKPATNGGANPAFPANKAQLYNAARQAYRPQPKRGHRRGCCCRFCICTTLLILVLLVLAAIAGAVFYFIYRPHPPSFSVASLQLSKFNLTDAAVTSAFNISLTVRNRNSKIIFSYDQINVKILYGDVDIGEGSFPGFQQGKENTTTLRTVASSSNSPFPDGTDISPLKSSLKSKNLPIEIQLDTKLKAKMGKFETKNLTVRITCDGIKISVPSGKTAMFATIPNVKCKIDPRIKISRWTV